MKLNLDRNAKIKITLILAVILAAPYFAPFAIEFIILADFLGPEALLVFLFASSRSALTVLNARLSKFCRECAETASIIVKLPLFTPRIYMTHATASTLFAVFACSVFLACMVWLPVMMMSMRTIS
jgi:hypothetical protein